MFVLVFCYLNGDSFKTKNLFQPTVSCSKPKMETPEQYVKSKCGKTRTRITPNRDAFYAVYHMPNYLLMKLVLLVAVHLNILSLIRKLLQMSHLLQLTIVRLLLMLGLEYKEGAAFSFERLL